MTSLTALTQYLETEIAALQFPSAPANLYDPLRYFLTLGGKRMRPVLTLMGAELFGCDKEKAVSAALAIELFHNFSLIHDDIMDEAPLRRGMATVHEKWNTNVAILSGDVLLVKAYQQLSYYKNDQLSALFERFNQTATEVCDGQQMDMDFETRKVVSEVEYIEMIRLKTSVLLGCAFEFGAIVANASMADRKNMYEFGVNLGIAFQIQDDLLDLYANPDQFGKQVGGDILSNKKTLLLIEAMNKIPNETEHLLQMAPNEEKVRKAKDLFTAHGVTELVQSKMNEYYDLAMLNLSNLSQEDAQKQSLRDLAEFLIHRVN